MREGYLRRLSGQVVRATGLVILNVLMVVATASALPADSQGSVKFFVDANSSFDPWTQDPSLEQQAWMRENYFRMKGYSSYFDQRLSWYPNAWFYKDSYAIKPGSPVFGEHPEWILRDAAGDMLYIPFGCSGGTCPQYAADIGNAEFRAWWIAAAKSKIDLGYKGLWVDDVNFDWRISNGDGVVVRPIDPRTSQEMTLQDWRRYFAEFLEALRNELPSAEIAHNVIWYAQPVDDPYILRAFEATDYVNLERGITDRGIRSGTGTYGFETFLALVDRAHAMGKHIILDDDDDDSAVDRNYELAFYFLINDGADLIGADGDRNRMSPDNFWPGYETQLGAAKASRYQWNGLFRRDFDCGIVLVNQPDSPTITQNLDATYTDLDGLDVSSVVMDAATGEVLVGECATPREPMPPSNLQ